MLTVLKGVRFTVHTIGERCSSPDLLLKSDSTLYPSRRQGSNKRRPVEGRSQVKTTVYGFTNRPRLGLVPYRVVPPGSVEGPWSFIGHLLS